MSPPSSKHSPSFSMRKSASGIPSLRRHSSFGSATDRFKKEDKSKALDKYFTEDIEYVALTGNEIDMMLAEIIKKNNIKMPIVRIPGDQDRYLIGTKIVHAKMLKGELFMRVGGGFVTIPEFVVKYENGEIARLKQAMVKTDMNLE